MERNMGLFGLADFIVKKNRNKSTFLDEGHCTTA